MHLYCCRLPAVSPLPPTCPVRGFSDTVWELLQFVPATLPSEPGTEPADVTAVLPSLVAAESRLTPLHLAALAGHEDTARLLLNSSGDAPVGPVTAPTVRGGGGEAARMSWLRG